MKKLFVVLFIAFSAMVISSCNGEKQLEFIYSLQSEGVSDGFVDMTFVNGDFMIKGNAEYTFSLTNEATSNLTEVSAVNLKESLESDEENLLKAATKTNYWIDSVIQVKDYNGTYDIHIKGYVIETLTGIKFEVDKRFTNAIDPNLESEFE